MKPIFRQTSIGGMLIIYLLLAIVPFLVIDHFPRAIIQSIIGVGVLTAVIEVYFRFSYQKKFGGKYILIPKLPFRKLYIEPHPYLPYVYKKHMVGQKEMPATYSLHKKKGYRFGSYSSNNFRHTNGIHGDRDIAVPKPKGMLRINCVGDCITGNYIKYQDVDYSYPIELEKLLLKKYPQKNIEVNNCGNGCYSTAEVLIKFLLSTIDTQPDIVVLYNGYNDLEPSLTPDFENDYSHSRRNLAGRYNRYKFSSLIPFIPLAFYNYIVNYYCSQNIRFSLYGDINTGTANLDMDFQGLEVYRRNTEHMINICKANNIFVILSTYSYFLYERVKNSKMHIKLHEGTLKHNEIIRQLANKHKCALVDSYNNIPPEEKYYVDCIHFTPEGMKLLSEHIALEIDKFLNS